MNTLLLALSMAVLGSHAAPPDAITGFVSVRSDAQGRIQVVVDHDDESPYTAYLFQPAEAVRPIPVAICKAIVVKSTGRLTVDGVEGQPLHLDLYLPTSKERAAAIGTFPSLRLQGLALQGFEVPRDAGFIDRISTDTVPPLLGAGDPAVITCLGGKVVKDSGCQVGGPGSLYSPSFKCPGRQASSPIPGWTGSAGEAGRLGCADGYYGCGYCSGAPNLVIANQECRAYDACPKPSVPLIPTLPLDPGP